MIFWVVYLISSFCGDMDKKGFESHLAVLGMSWSFLSGLKDIYVAEEMNRSWPYARQVLYSLYYQLLLDQ